jgi:hypothetical protein
MEELKRKQNEQWERCLVYLKQFEGVKKDCNLVGEGYCPMKCDYAKRFKEYQLVNENLQRRK